jgi:bifunctional UDP-N-acetylglucosamine pyrophosphorylase/glucosamine-1-phosphate N-acetyltransferase
MSSGMTGVDEKLAMVVLAAGEGTRMRSRTPKVLHPLLGRPLVHYPLALARTFGIGRVVVVIGQGAEALRDALSGDASLPVELAVQAERLGTAHAVAQARELLRDHAGVTIVTCGDMPLVQGGTLRRLVAACTEGGADLALATATLEDPGQYGRIVRDSTGKILRIVEAAVATPEECALREVNLGLYVARTAALFAWIAAVERNPTKGEYLLTDIVTRALAGGHGVETVEATDWTEALGVNTRIDLAAVEAHLQRRVIERWMLEGVTFERPDTTRVEIDVTLGRDTVIAPFVSLRGTTRIGELCRIGEGSVIESSSLGEGVWIKPSCHIEHASIGDRCVLGPMAHLRPDTRLAEDVRIGNFVEVKNTTIGAGSKADHLSYLGDADVGAGITFGCGAVTVNYDGLTKSRTKIGDGAFVGCNANLIAPVVVEGGGYVAAGSTITTNVPPDALAVARARQRNIEGWRTRREPKRPVE